MWLIKAKESQQFQFFLPLVLLIFMLMNFNPLINLLLFVPQGEDLSFFSFVRGTNLFSVSKFTCSPKKESEKLTFRICLSQNWKTTRARRELFPLTPARSEFCQEYFSLFYHSDQFDFYVVAVVHLLS